MENNYMEMVNAALKVARKIWKGKEVIDNPTRQKILSMLVKESLSITEIQKKLRINYKNVHEHIKRLEKLGLIKRTPETTKETKIMRVSIIPGSAEKLLRGWNEEWNKAFNDEMNKVKKSRK